MKITVFTGNSRRHLYLLNYLKEQGHEVFSIIEKKKRTNIYKSEIINKYFKKVEKAEQKIFKKNSVINLKKKIKLIQIEYKSLSKIKLSSISNFLKSDLYLVFGSSLIKNKLLAFLKKKETLNIHMGISPYYRGTNCNFWSMYDKNYHLVGATIHRLSDKIDGGHILHYAKSEYVSDPFIYSMSTVKSAFFSLKNIFNKKKLKFFKQDRNKEIKYSKHIDFTEDAINIFYKNKKQKKNKVFKSEQLSNFYLLKKNIFYD